MREALAVIADFTDSQRLREFLETGQDRKFWYGVVAISCSLIRSDS